MLLILQQGLSNSRRVNTGVVSFAHGTGDIGFKPTKGLKWKGKQAMTQIELHVQSVMRRIQTRSTVVGIQTRAQAKGKSPSKKTSYFNVCWCFRGCVVVTTKLKLVMVLYFCFFVVAQPNLKYDYFVFWCLCGCSTKQKVLTIFCFDG
ncbi:hypothetical protein RDI58_013297 [Solanum bulbocastanum]|uniref:Uncharacterized protein n=1 Tax=Solanum bulbocastanum TaxID=147425 RepID=A0AAN8TQF7_SOLBU